MLANMKTTIDLPEDLVHDLKLRALHDRRKLKDLAADLLRNALSTPSHPKTPPPPVILKDKLTGLPVIQCPSPAPQNRRLTPNEVARILAEQESQWATGQTDVSPK